MRGSNAWRRRGLAIAASALLGGCAFVAGVDFDRAQLANDEDADAGLRSPGSSGDSAPSADGATVSPPSNGDASTTSDASIGDAGLDAPDAFDAKACDEDGDGFLSAACGGDDCDDHDSRTHPDAGFLMDPPVPPRMGDWNCNGVVEKGWPVVWTACSGGATGCPQKSGFVADTPCGAANTFKSCGVQNNACVLFVTYSPTQSCR